MEAGISYTEFSYMLLQAYDFLELRRRHDVRIQMGGSDQWGNITAGIELIRRCRRARRDTRSPRRSSRPSAGTKFGKTEGGAIWLDATLTTPYKFYQFLVNVDDRDAAQIPPLFHAARARRRSRRSTTRSRIAPKSVRRSRALAREVTNARPRRARARRGRGGVRTVVRQCRTAVAVARRAARAAGSRSRCSRSNRRTRSRRRMCSRRRSSAREALFESKGDLRRMLQQGGVYMNGRRLSPEREPVSKHDLLGGEFVLIRKGSKSYGLVKVRLAYRRGAPSTRSTSDIRVVEVAATAESPPRATSARHSPPIEPRSPSPAIARTQRDDSARDAPDRSASRSRCHRDRWPNRSICARAGACAPTISSAPSS